MRYRGVGAVHSPQNFSIDIGLGSTWKTLQESFKRKRIGQRSCLHGGGTSSVNRLLIKDCQNIAGDLHLRTSIRSRLNAVWPGAGLAPTFSNGSAARPGEAVATRWNGSICWRWHWCQGTSNRQGRGRPKFWRMREIPFVSALPPAGRVRETPCFARCQVASCRLARPARRPEADRKFFRQGAISFPSTVAPFRRRWRGDWGGRRPRRFSTGT